MSKKSKQTIGAVGIAVALMVAMFGILTFGDSGKWEAAERAEKAMTEKAKQSVTKAIKEDLNDPESFKLVSFQLDEGVATIVYRCKNAFNATIRCTNTAKVDSNGRVIKNTIRTTP